MSADLVRAELVEALAELGLNRTEGRLYVALAEAGPGTAAELARRARVPRPKAYESLGSLERRGLVSSVLGRVNRYVPTPPDEGLPQLLVQLEERRQAAARREQEMARRLAELLPRPPEPPLQPPSGDYMEAISGRARLTETLERMMADATGEIVLMNRPPFLVPRPRWNLAEIEALRRGTPVRTIYTPEALQDRHRWEPLLAAGGQLRVLQEVRMKLLICGPDQALISLRDAATGEQSSLSTVVRHPDLVEPLRLLFEQHWSEATPVPN
jgi:HTH-type transcriptional regulator, sugar sensing transcriptional regulator